MEQKKNPFSIIAMAHIKTMETRENITDRLHWKINMVKMLYKQGHTKKDILELFKFIDWVMALPKELESQFTEQIYKYEEETHMQYITNIERRGLQQGIQQGIKNSQETVIEILDARFQTAPLAVIERINTIDDLSELKSLLKNAAITETIEDFEKLLKDLH